MVSLCSRLSLTVVISLLYGCASLAESELLFSELSSRRPPDVIIGPEVVLLEHPPTHLSSLIATDGQVHLFLVGEAGTLYHLSVDAQGRISREDVDRFNDETGSAITLDAVEFPPGTLRLLVGDRQYATSVGRQDWRRIDGNPCLRYLPIVDTLYCAALVDGRIVSAPERTDWSGGLFFILPVAWYANKIPLKLAIAEETTDGWVLRVVVDQKSPLDADGDFFAAIDEENAVHLLYAETHGGSWLLVGGGPGGAGAFGGSGDADLHYARINHEKMVAASEPSRGGPDSLAGDDQNWLSIETTSVPRKWPFIYDSGPFGINQIFRPVNRHFVTSSGRGTLSALFLTYQMDLTDGRKTYAFRSDDGWVLASLREGKWGPEFEILTAKDLPHKGINWSNDVPFFLRDHAGETHLLLQSCVSGSGSFPCGIFYLATGNSGWSAPLELGTALHDNLRSLAVGANGEVFAVWVDSEGQLVGRWLLQSGI